MLFNNLTDAYEFETWLREKREISDSTIYVYVGTINRFLRNSPNLSDIHVYNEFLIKFTHKRRCPHYYFALKAYIDFKITDKKLKLELFEGLRHPKTWNDTKRPRRFLSEDQIYKLINSLEEYKHQMISLLQMRLGIRAGDVMSIKEDDIQPEIYKDDFVLKLNIRGKGDRINVSYLFDKNDIDLLINFMNDCDEKEFSIDDYLFLTWGRWIDKHRTRKDTNEALLKKMNYLWYWRDLKQALFKCGINKEDFATHDFRRCYARKVWEKYRDLELLQRMLNHTGPNATIRYLRQSGMRNIDVHKELQAKSS